MGDYLSISSIRLMGYLQNRLNGFKNAFSGIWLVFRNEPNAQIHLLAAVVVVVLGCFFDINYSEWCLIVFCIVMVISAEIFNTSIEQLADTITLENHPKIKIVKDASAGAVLILAIGAAIVGAIIFLPYFLSIL